MQLNHNHHIIRVPAPGICVLEETVNFYTRNSSPVYACFSSGHLLYLQADVLEVIVTLFNSMLNHASLPSDMTFSLLVPLIKDNSGPLDVKSNYRAIALSTSMTKLLEFILVEKLAPFLQTGDAQFGFKEDHSTTLVTHVLKETVNFYTRNGSPVYAVCLFFRCQ